MPTSVRLRRLFVPASIGLMLVVAVGWYNFFWLPSKHRYLDDRNFRILKTLSEQIRLGINNFDKMMDHAADSGITRERLNDYLSNVAPQLEKPDDEETESIIGSGDYGDPPRIVVVADEGTHFLYMAFKRRVATRTASTKGKPIQYAIRTDLDKLIRQVLPPPSRDPFNILLVARENGTVIFQKSSPGIEVVGTDVFEDESAAVKETKTKDTAAPPELRGKKLSQSSRYGEVILAGARYRLYSQPLQLSFPPVDLGRKRLKEEATPTSDEKWVLCGLERADAFRSESQSISYTYILWLSAAILMAVAAYPFLKLHLSSPIERLRRRDVVTVAVFACIVAAALTFILSDYYWRHDFALAAEADMKALAESIDTNFGNEKAKAFEQLHDFYSSSSLGMDLRAAQSRTSKLPVFTPTGGCSPKEACRVRILADGNVGQYPYMQLASWSDFNGNQQVKWTTKEGVTPFINLKAQGYYPDVKGAFTDIQRAFVHPESATFVPTQGVGSDYSSNTGENITIFWKLFDRDGTAVSPRSGQDTKDVFCASLVTHPISVLDPVLPDGLQFAVIKPDGTVIYHSDRTRNLRENFLDETDQNQEVLSRVLMRASGTLIANYMGRPHRLYISPMDSSEGQLWTVVVFRDLQLEDTTNLEMLSLGSIMFFLYASATILALALVHYARTGWICEAWLWPDSRKTRTYLWLATGNGVVAALFLLLFQLPAFLALLLCGYVIPMAAIVCNLLLLSRHDDPSSCEDEENTENTTSSRWRLHFAGASATLLVVVAVLPCLCFFKVAFDFEHKLMIARNQLALVSDLDERARRVRRGYQRIELGKYGNTLLVAPGDPAAEPEKLPAEHERGTAPFFSYHQILRTSVNSTQYYDLKGFAPPACDLRSPEGRQQCVEQFLSWSSPAYDQLAFDNRYLAESGSTSARSWSSTSFGNEEKLELKILDADKTSRKIASLWTSVHIPWTDGRWWLGTVALIAALFGLVWWSLQRVFLLNLRATVSPENLETICDPSSLVARLSMNLLVIGSESSPTVASLIHRREVQAWDIQDMLNSAQHSAKTADGTSFISSSAGDQVDEIIRDGRPLVLYNCEATFDTPRTNHQSLAILGRVLSNLASSVVITTTVDPELRVPAGQNNPWTSLLQPFVRIDLNLSSAQRVDETLEQFESRLSSEAYQRWLFPRRSRPEKLVLVHLAQERLVSPNSGGIVRELMREGVVVRRWGLLTIKDSRFAEFVKCAVPPDMIKHWETQGAGTRSASLRHSLLIVGAGVVGFLIYTQGEVFNTWITYATGLAASIPAFIRVFAMFRGKSSTEA